jgi:hypothetical protein
VRRTTVALVRPDRRFARESRALWRLCAALDWVAHAMDVHEEALWMNANVLPCDERARAWDDDPQCRDADDWREPIDLRERVGEPWRVSRGGQS